MLRRTHRILREMFDRLIAAYGPQHWWPGDTAVEVVVGAILTQNTAWGNVERAIENLKRAEALDFGALNTLGEDDLAELIRSAGTFRIKAKRLKAFVEVLYRDHAGSLDSMLAGDIEAARRRLLAIKGIGPETADAILLYAADRPTFVVDAYTKRVLRRHLFMEPGAGYETVRRLFHDAVNPNAAIYNEYHALLVAVGKRHCRTRARCAGCPLEGFAHDAGL